MSLYEQFENHIAELHDKQLELQKEIEHFEKKLAEQKAKMNEYDWPSDGDTYWIISSTGNIYPSVFASCDWCDRNRKAIGNTYKTQEEALFAVERLKVLAEMRKFAFEPDWDNELERKYILSYNTSFDEIAINEMRTESYWSIAFPDKESAKACIDAIGAERLKKYYFGVKDDV